MKLSNQSIFLRSSLASIITIGYIGFAYVNKQYPRNVPYGTFVVFLPILYGIFGLVNHFVIRNIGIEYSLVVGGLFGLMLSIVGRFIFNLPSILFNFTTDTEYMVHIYAIILYALILRYVITPITS